MMPDDDRVATITINPRSRLSTISSSCWTIGLAFLTARMQTGTGLHRARAVRRHPVWVIRPAWGDGIIENES
jgi:hypothetical protein